MEHTCCNVELDHESAGNRDTETMGGLDVEYLRCSICGQGYDLIRDRFDGDRLSCNDDEKSKSY